MTRLSDIFDIKYGVNLELCKLEESPSGIPFVSRSGGNNGVSAYVQPVEGVEPNPAGTLSIALGGSVLATFLQKQSYYSGRDLSVAIPKYELTDQEMLYYALCISSNAYRFSYGRQANRTLPDLLVPSLDEIPIWVNETVIPALDIPAPKKEPLDTSSWQWFSYSDLFDIKRGTISSLGDYEDGETPVVTASATNNGVSAWIDREADFEGGVITVSTNGSIGEAFYQPEPFCASSDVAVFVPRFEMRENIALFLCTLIRLEKPRYNYGRKWGTGKMKDSKIKLPVIPGSSSIDWEWIEEYMQQFESLKSVLTQSVGGI